MKLTPLSRSAAVMRDLISLMIYACIFFRKRSGTVTLLYHSIGHVPPDHDLYRLNITPEEFEKHLRIISGNRSRVKVSFDDGFGNNFEHAFPLLKKYGVEATIFLIADFIDGTIHSEDFAGKGFNERPLTWDEIRAMGNAGIKFGSHSKTHPVLTELSQLDLDSELTSSRERIEKELGHRIGSFGYPFGSADSFNASVKDAVRASGYSCAYTNSMGSNNSQDDRFALKRVRIGRGDGVLKLKMKIRGAYDWVDRIRER